MAEEKVEVMEEVVEKPKRTRAKKAETTETAEKKTVAKRTIKKATETEEVKA